ERAGADSRAWVDSLARALDVGGKPVVTTRRFVKSPAPLFTDDAGDPYVSLRGERFFRCGAAPATGRLAPWRPAARTPHRCRRRSSGKRRTAPSSADRFHFLLMGITRSRTSSVVALSEMARLGRTGSAPSLSIALTIPAVDTVMRRGESPSPIGSVSISRARA